MNDMTPTVSVRLCVIGEVNSLVDKEQRIYYMMILYTLHGC